MKKNIFSVIITVLTVVNVVLTAIMFFVMVPTFNKTNNLITQVASVLNLELDGDSDASADADLISSVAAGTQLNSTGVCENGWIRVDYNGQTCYASGDFVTTTAPAADAGETAADTSADTSYDDTSSYDESAE